MPRSLKLYITGVVALSAIALIATTFAYPIEQPIGLAFDVFGDRYAPIAGLAFWWR